MKKEISEALVEFYHQLLQPEFAAIHSKLAEHDERFREIDGHFNCVYHRLDRLDQEMQTTKHCLKRLDGQMGKLETKLDAVAVDLTAHRADTEVHRQIWQVREDGP